MESARLIKAKSLADFIVECLVLDESKREDSNSWMLYVDGSITNKGIGAGLTVLSHEGRKYEHTLKFMFKASNSEAEYEVLLGDMEI